MDGVAARRGLGLTRRAVVVAGQHGTLVVAQAVPVLRVAGADSQAGGGEAVGDDSVGNVRRLVQYEGNNESYASMAVPQPD